MKEIWKNINGYNRKYKISNTGKVVSLKENKKRELKLHDNGYGYLCVILCLNGKNKNHKVHRLVAETFLPNPNNFPCINHKDENKHNNNANNLEWCTYSYNNCYGKRIEKVVEKTSKELKQYDLKGNFIKKWKNASEVQRKLGYKANCICCCCNGIYKTSYGFIWKYIAEEE